MGRQMLSLRMARGTEVIGHLGIHLILVIPIFFREKVIGTLFLRTSREHAFNWNEARPLNTITHTLTNALYKAFVFEQVEEEESRLEKLSITDFLAGIYNVRYFLHRIVEEFSHALRWGFSIGCLMVDIDNFTKTNDAHGHKGGDRVLEEFARLPKKRYRNRAVLACYEGEKFIVFLPQTLDGGVTGAPRVLDCVRNHKFRSIGTKVDLAVSIGGTVFPCDAVKMHDDLVACPDDAPFAAKKKGRNHVSVCKDRPD